MGFLSANAAARLTAILFVSAAASRVLAAPPDTWTPDKNFPDYYQKSDGVNNGDCACAPVAAVDSIFWLADKYKLTNLTKDPKDPTKDLTWQQLTNLLETNTYMKTAKYNTTYAGYFAEGKKQYFKDAGYENKIVQKTQLGGSKDPPTLNFIKSEVSAGEDVEILVLWMKNGAKQGDPAVDVGGHWVAVTGYDKENLLVADPWNDNNSNSDKMPILGTKDVTYNFGSFGPPAIDDYTQSYLQVTLDDGLTFPGTDFQMVFAAVSESPVPEPGTWAMMVLGFGGLAYVAFPYKGQNRRTNA